MSSPREFGVEGSLKWKLVLVFCGNCISNPKLGKGGVIEKKIFTRSWSSFNRMIFYSFNLALPSVSGILEREMFKP